MTGIHPDRKFFENDWAIALTVVPILMLYGSFNMFPVIRGEWGWATHGAGNLFSTGLLLAAATAFSWKAYNEYGSNGYKYVAWTLTVIAFILISIPAFFMLNTYR